MRSWPLWSGYNLLYSSTFWLTNLKNGGVVTAESQRQHQLVELGTGQRGVRQMPLTVWYAVTLPDPVLCHLTGAESGRAGPVRNAVQEDGKRHKGRCEFDPLGPAYAFLDAARKRRYDQ